MLNFQKEGKEFKVNCVTFDECGGADDLAQPSTIKFQLELDARQLIFLEIVEAEVVNFADRKVVYCST